MLRWRLDDEVALGVLVSCKNEEVAMLNEGDEVAKYGVGGATAERQHPSPGSTTSLLQTPARPPTVGSIIIH
jgi:hypothetical protein